MKPYVPITFKSERAAQWELDMLLRHHGPNDPWRQRLVLVHAGKGFVICEHEPGSRWR